MIVKLVFDKNFDDFDDSEEHLYSEDEIKNEGGILEIVKRFKDKNLILEKVVYIN